MVSSSPPFSSACPAQGPSAPALKHADPHGASPSGEKLDRSFNRLRMSVHGLGFIDLPHRAPGRVTLPYVALDSLAIDRSSDRLTRGSSESR